MNHVRHQVHDLLLLAAGELQQAADGQKAWDYGWCSPEYRKSPDARLSGPSGTYQLSAAGVEKYEAAVEMLLAEQRIRQRWDSDELWGVVGSLIVYLSISQATAETASSQVGRLREAAPSTVLFPVANIQWEGPPLVVAETAVLGEWGDPRFAAAVSALRNSTGGEHPDVAEYLVEQDRGRPMAGFATKVASQRSKAFAEASKHLEQLCDIALLLLRDKELLGLYSMRGAWNRPGVRGLILDRGTVESALAGTEYSAELASQPLVMDELGRSSAHHWHSAEPLPMHKMLEDPALLRALERTLNVQVGVPPRIRLAARWYAEAFWAKEQDDSVLALGVALDALIGSKSGLPGRVMRDRYALLDQEPLSRRERAQRYDEIFGVRSSVAHGGSSSRIGESGFLRGIDKDVTWAAWQMILAESTFGEELTSDLDQLFDQLRWGVVCWPARGDAN